jgi:hypothetical protein
MDQVKCPAEIVGRPKNINVARALLKLKKHNDGAPFVVMAWLLNKDIVDEDGKVDNLYGCCIDMGHYHSYDDAVARCKEIINITGHNGVRVIKLGQPLPLTMKLDPAYGEVKDIPVDEHGNFITLAEKQVEERNRLMEERVKLEKEIIQEQMDILDPDNLEHFKYQVYLVVQCFQKISAHENYIRDQKRVLRESVDKLRKYYNKYPENEAGWLEWYKAKLLSRNEMNIYHMVSNMYETHREAFLGINGKDILDQVDVEVCESSSEEELENEDVHQDNEQFRSDDEGELSDSEMLDEAPTPACTPEPVCSGDVCRVCVREDETEQLPTFPSIVDKPLTPGITVKAEIDDDGNMELDLSLNEENTEDDSKSDKGEDVKLSKNARRKLRRKNMSESSDEAVE